jgi:hypothetical protein
MRWEGTHVGKWLDGMSEDEARALLDRLWGLAVATEDGPMGAPLVIEPAGDDRG